MTYKMSELLQKYIELCLTNKEDIEKIVGMIELEVANHEFKTQLTRINKMQETIGQIGGTNDNNTR